MRTVLPASLYIFLLFLLIFFSACSTTRHLEEGEYLLKKNNINTTAIDTIEDSRNLERELTNLYQQEPNSKFLFFFPVGLWLYNPDRDTSKWFNRFISENLAQEPVIFDSVKAARTAQLMERFLFTKGYFHSSVTFETDTTSNQKVEVTYNVVKRDLTWTHDVVYDIENERMRRVAMLNQDRAALQPHTPYDVDQLIDERQRITRNMRNYGYYRFNNRYVYFEVDTLPYRDSLDIYIKISPPPEDTVHRVYFINNVHIYPDYVRDTALTYLPEDTIKIDEYAIISKNLQYEPEALLDAVFFQKDDLYAIRDQELTTTRLTDLGVFRFVNIEFIEVQKGNQWYLDVVIKLLPAQKQRITWDAEAYTSSGFIGSELGVTYQNKNLFNYTDLFVWNLRVGAETLTGSGTGSTGINTLDFNTDASIFFPKFLLPFYEVERVSRVANPKTRISLGFNYYQRLQLFTLNSINGRYGFDWNDHNTTRHTVDILDLNYVDIYNRTDSFAVILRNNPLLARSFTDQFILGAGYTYTYNNQPVTRKNHAWYFRFTGETTLWSYLLWAAQTGLTFEPNQELLKTNYSTYIKPDVELRYYRSINRQSSWVARGFAGVGLAVGNTKVMPYIKQYVIGGANSLRAFRIRSLGPGSYPLDTVASTYLDQTGDIKIEANLEYRFDLSRILEGAVFLDAGNIWLLRESPQLPGAEFQVGNFLQDMALGTGFGLRLDFNFFILRLDFGIPVRDPRLRNISDEPLLDGNPIVITHFFDSDWKAAFERHYGRSYPFINFNLAIGYPF